MKPRALLVASIAAACACGPHPRAPVAGRDTFVRMERTECLGPCPIYSVTLFEDGAVEYVGSRNAPRGVTRRRIDPAEVVRIMDAIERIAPWRCHPDRIETDYPSSILTLSRGGRVRRIVHDHGDPCAPVAVPDIEAAIDVAGGHPQLVPYVTGTPGP